MNKITKWIYMNVMFQSPIRMKIGSMYYDLVNYFRYGTVDMFNTIFIEISTFCNRKCAYCPNSKYGRGNHDMDKNTLTKIVTELKNMKWKGNIFLHFFNEPLLSRNIIEYSRYIKSELPKCKLYVDTNGDFLDENIYKELYSVDTFLVTNHGNFNNNIPKKSNVLLNKIRRYSTRGGLVEVPKGKIKEDLHKCYSSNYNATFLWNGDMIICCVDYFGANKFGNVNDESVMGIWTKEEYRQARKELKKGVPVFKICNECLNGKGG